MAAAPRTAELFFTDVGAGENVLLLHGWTCDSHDWSWQLPVLESRYRVVAVDLRGHGSSEVMPPGAYAPADYVPASGSSWSGTRWAGRSPHVWLPYGPT
jgi:pimeloyl-ACP methyl ester carboxylesterase